MSRLTDKVASYSHWKGISFDEATYTTTPTRTGSKTPYTTMLNANFVQDGVNQPTIVEGPMPGQNAYRFTLNSNTSPLTTSRLYHGSTSSGSVGSTSDIRRACYDNYPFDRLFGIWMKFPDGVSSTNGILTAHRYLGGSNGQTVVMGVAMGKSNTGLPAISLPASDSGASSSQLSTLTQYGNAIDGYQAFEFNKWYFIAWRKQLNITDTFPTVNTTVNGSVTYTLYVNGIKTVTAINTSPFIWYSVNMIEFGRTSAAFGLNSFDMANWFVTEWSDIDEQGLKDIYKYGSPTNRPYQNADIRHYDGTSFVQASNERVYRNGSWQDVFASRWDGTQWLPI